MPCKEEEDDSQISQNLNENLAEHEVVTETLIYPSTGSGQAPLKIERITDRQRTLVSGSQMQDTKVVVRTETVRDTVYVERTDTVLVQEIAGRARNEGSSLNPRPSPLNYLKWILWILIGLIGLTLALKFKGLRV